MRLTDLHFGAANIEGRGGAHRGSRTREVELRLRTGQQGVVQLSAGHRGQHVEILARHREAEGRVRGRQVALGGVEICALGLRREQVLTVVRRNDVERRIGGDDIGCRAERLTAEELRATFAVGAGEVAGHVGKENAVRRAKRGTRALARRTCLEVQRIISTRDGDGVLEGQDRRYGARVA